MVSSNIKTIKKHEFVTILNPGRMAGLVQCLKLVKATSPGQWQDLLRYLKLAFWLWLLF